MKMTTAHHNISSTVSQINRRALLAGASTVAAATAGTAKAAAPVFAPSALGREMIALKREWRASDAESEAFEQLVERFEQLAAKIFAEPLSPANLVDRALAEQFAALNADEEKLSAAWLPDSDEPLDPHNCKGSVNVAVLALAGLPVEA
jgi:hypothetical protein